MKYHKENLHCVYVFKEAQKCYAKLMNSYDKIENWLMTSGLFVSDTDDKNCGGVYSFYDEKSDEFSFLYPEITGYFISTMKFLNSYHDDKKYSQYAKLSSDWLIEIFEKYGSIVQGIKFDKPISNLSYSFDLSICAKGLLDYYEISNNKYYLDYARKILKSLSDEFLESDGSLMPYKDVKTDLVNQSNEMWYKQKGCLHIKVAIPFFQISQYSHEDEFLQTGTTICNKIYDFQNLDGSIRLHEKSNIINLHTMCYALEGLVYAYYVTKNENYLKNIQKAIDWCINQISDDGSINLWHNSKYNSKSAYPIAQLIRILILVDKIQSNMKFKSHTTRLYNFLISLQGTSNSQKINGGFYEEFYKSIFGWKKRLRINSWTSMFALQAIYWNQNYDKISFEEQIKFLY